MKKRTAVFLVLLALIAMPIFGQSDTNQRRIFFETFKDDIYSIRSINPAGSNEQRIAESYNSAFSLSPNGKQLLYEYESQHIDLYLINSDGSNPQRLTDSGDNYSPQWSAAGDQIAFIHEQDYQYSIQVIQVNDVQHAEAVFQTPQIIADLHWLPDEKAFVFMTWDARFIVCGLNFVQADGSSWQNLTTNFIPSVSSVALSPDSKQVAFAASPNNDPSVSDLYTIDLATRKISKLTHISARYGSLIWSADSQFLVFATDLGGDWEIYKLNLATEQQTDLTNAPNLQDGFYGLDISYPDNLIVYTTGPIDGYHQILTMSFDGSNKKQITSDEIDKVSPVWGR